MKINDLGLRINRKLVTEQRLDEIFQMERAAPWKWTNNNLVYPIEAHFSINEIDYIAGFYPSPFGESNNAYITGFAVDKGEAEGTNIFQRFEDGMFDSQGNEIKVFRTIMDIIANFVKENQPDEIHIVAIPDRAKIYGKILSKFNSEIEKNGYRIGEPEYTSIPPYGNVVIFSLEKKRINEGINLSTDGITWESESNKEVNAYFKLNKAKFKVNFMKIGQTHLVEFYRIDNKTSPVNSFDVFSKVISALAQYIEAYEPIVIGFAAEDKLFGLYKKYLKLLKGTVANFGYKVTVNNSMRMIDITKLDVP